MRSVAEEYAREGWLAFPIPYGTKGDKVKWGELTQEEALAKFNGHDTNIAVALGERSNHLIDVDLDADHPAAGYVASVYLPETASVFGRKSRPQTHWLYYDAERTGVRRKRWVNPVTGEILAEIRGSGHMTVFPPSLHPDAEFYEWDDTGEPGTIPTLDCLSRALGRFSAVFLVASLFREGQKHDLFLALSGVLRRVGWTEDESTEFVALCCDVGGDDDPQDRLGCVLSTYGRDDDVSGWPTLRRFVERLGVQDPRGVVDALSEWIGGNVDETPRRSGALVLVRASELREATYPPRTWPISGLVGGGLSILLGKPKGGKSFLSLQAAVAVAEGRDVMGRFGTERGPVVYYALEDTPERLQRRLRGMLGEAPWPKDLYLVTGAVNGEEELRGHLEGVVRDVSPSLVVVDTLGMVRNAPTGDGSSFLGDYRSMSVLKQAADATNTNILVVHHVRKGSDDDDIMTASSGTFGIVAAADTVLRIYTKDNTKRLEVVGRDVEAKEWEIAFQGSTLSWTVSGESSTESSSAGTTGRPTSRDTFPVMSYLSRRHEEEPKSWVTQGDICANLRRTPDSIRPIIRSLMAEGNVEFQGGKGYRIIPWEGLETEQIRREQAWIANQETLRFSETRPEE